VSLAIHCTVGATKKLPTFWRTPKHLILKTMLTQSVQSIMGATEIFLSKINAISLAALNDRAGSCACLFSR
jgi:hypothetical protein